jgi:hypothetical protein
LTYPAIKWGIFPSFFVNVYQRPFLTMAAIIYKVTSTCTCKYANPIYPIYTSYESYIITLLYTCYIPAVPHKAVAEVSKIGNL